MDRQPNEDLRKANARIRNETASFKRRQQDPPPNTNTASAAPDEELRKANMRGEELEQEVRKVDYMSKAIDWRNERVNALMRNSEGQQSSHLATLKRPRQNTPPDTNPATAPPGKELNAEPRESKRLRNEMPSIKRREPDNIQITDSASAPPKGRPSVGGFTNQPATQQAGNPSNQESPASRLGADLTQTDVRDDGVQAQQAAKTSERNMVIDLTMHGLEDVEIEEDASASVAKDKEAIQGQDQPMAEVGNQTAAGNPAPPSGEGSSNDANGQPVAIQQALRPSLAELADTSQQGISQPQQESGPAKLPHQGPTMRQRIAALSSADPALFRREGAPPGFHNMLRQQWTLPAPLRFLPALDPTHEVYPLSVEQIRRIEDRAVVRTLNNEAAMRQQYGLQRTSPPPQPPRPPPQLTPYQIDNTRLITSRVIGQRSQGRMIFLRRCMNPATNRVDGLFNEIDQRWELTGVQMVEACFQSTVPPVLPMPLQIWRSNINDLQALLELIAQWPGWTGTDRRTFYLGMRVP